MQLHPIIGHKGLCQCQCPFASYLTCVNPEIVCNMHAWIFFSKQRYVTNFQLDFCTLPFTITAECVLKDGLTLDPIR